MNNDCKSCGNDMPWLSLYRRCFNALRAQGSKIVRVPWMMAVCVLESNGDGFFGTKSSELTSALTALKELTHVSIVDWSAYVVPAKPLPRFVVPKFRVEPEWWHLINCKRDMNVLTIHEKALLACSWGIAQQSGFYLNSGLTPHEQVGKIREFMWSEPAQLYRLVQELEILEKHFPSHGAMRFTRYNAGISAEEVNSYGTKALNISNGFEAALVKGGYVACLD